MANVETRRWFSVPFPPKDPAFAQEHVRFVVEQYRKRNGVKPTWVITPFHLFRAIAISAERPDAPESFYNAVPVDDTLVSWSPGVTQLTLAGPLPIQAE